MINRRSCLVATIVGLMFTSFAHPQNKPTRLTFDVATIRPSKQTDRNGGIKALPGGNGYTAQNIPVKLMISLMYKVPMRQITGGPDWLAGDRYNVEAKTDGSYNIDELHTMYQNLLADRFNLKFHVAIALRLARDLILPFTVRSGGHCTASGSFGEILGISSTATSSPDTRSCQRRSIGSYASSTAMSNRSARLRQPGTVGGSSAPRISRPRRDPRRFRSATGKIVTVGDRPSCGCACPAAWAVCAR